MKLPDGFILPIGSSYNLNYSDQELSQLIGFAGPIENPVGVAMSIRVHQIEGSANNSELQAALAASQRRSWVDNPHTIPLETPIVTTVLECAVSLGDMSLDDMDEALTPAFETVKSEVNVLLRSYAILTDNRIALVQRETLPVAIPAAWSLGHKGSDSRPEEQCLFLVNLFDSSIMGMSATTTEKMSDDEIVDMLERSNSLTGPLMTEIYTMLMDARLALQRGEHAVSVVLLASGCELYLRLLLEVLLWEDGVSPRDAVKEMFGPDGVGHSISHIVKSKFHGRLGGKWDITSTSNPVGRFYKAVFEKRNSYLHTGTTITESDADDASETTTNFLEFLNAQLAAKLFEYPFAAHLLIGEPTITHMGIQERIDAALRTKETELPISPMMYDCSSHFDGYRREVKVYRDPEVQGGAPLLGEINEQTHVALLIYPDGTVENWLVDPDRSVACRADTPDLSAEQAKSVRKVAKRSKRRPSNELSACRLLGVSAIPLESPPVWVSAHEVWRMEHKKT